ncbi:hypothetical protein PIB30_081617, partial [Stylosanthes scabra]|nr:hypothetical protein [Stylosanthes scabra]
EERRRRRRKNKEEDISLKHDNTKRKVKTETESCNEVGEQAAAALEYARGWCDEKKKIGWQWRHQ